MECIFCNKIGPFNTVEHIIPESLGNTDLLSKNMVCDECQNYFGKEIESFVLTKTPFAFWRVYYGLKSKRGEYPVIDLSLPDKQKGRIPNTHSVSDKKIKYIYDDITGLSVVIDDDEIVRKILSGTKTKFKFVLTPLILINIGRFLGKIAVELVHSEKFTKENTIDVRKLAHYARYGTINDIWPIISGTLKNRLSEWQETKESEVEERIIYEYTISMIGQLAIMFFDIGFERWGIILNSKYPHPGILERFKNKDSDDIQFLWYSPEQIKKEI